MFGPEYSWFLTTTRSARGLSVRLTRTSLLTLAVGSFCLSCALLPAGALLAHVNRVPAAPATAIHETAEAELPRILIRLWVLLPQFLPQDS